MKLLAALRRVAGPRITFHPERAKPRRYRFVTCCALALCLSLSPGCDRTAELVNQDATATASGSQLVGSKISPRTTIDECIQAYRRIASYEDRAFVLLRYKLDGRPTTDRAPLSIAWDRSGNLGMQVYSVVAGPTEGRWRMRIDQTDALAGHQVLSRALPRKLNFAWLLSDSIAAQSLSSGIAGFPPQLDMLLSENPLSGLVDQHATLASEPLATIDGRACHVISVTRGQSVYALMIDQATMLLRRIQLPKLNIPSEMLADQRVSDIQLTIEIENARTDGAPDWSRFRVETQSEDVLVNHFVPAPPEFETTGLGQRIPGFHLNDATGREIYNTARGGTIRKATVLLWLADHPACQLAAQQLAEAALATETAGLLRQHAVEFVPIWAEPNPPAGESFDSLVAAWNLPGSLALDTEAMGRDLFDVAEAPTLIVLDSNNRVQLRESRSNPLLGQLLPGLLSRLAAGEDLAAETLREAGITDARYQTELRGAAAVDARLPPSAELASYPPVFIGLTEIGSVSNPGVPMAATVDAQHMLWTLYADGKLVQAELRGNQPEVLAVYPTPWPADAKCRLLVSPSGTYIVNWSVNTSRIDIFEKANQQNRTINLSAGISPVDMQWLTLNGSSTPRLALITNDSQTVLLDPKNHEQLSGKCPTAPMAIVSCQRSDSSIDGFVVLRDQSVESLKLSGDSATHRVPLLGQPAAFVQPALDGDVAKSMPKHIGIQPALGPWSTWAKDETRWVLANGWLEQDEPAVFLLDQDLNPRWHYRVALQPQGPSKRHVAVASDPATGQPVWVLSDAEHTIHVLRADGLSDHFRLDAEFVSLILVPSGNRLVLGVVQAKNTVFYDLTWR